MQHFEGKTYEFCRMDVGVLSANVLEIDGLVEQCRSIERDTEFFPVLRLVDSFPDDFFDETLSLDGIQGTHLWIQAVDLALEAMSELRLGCCHDGCTWGPGRR